MDRHRSRSALLVLALVVLGPFVTRAADGALTLDDVLERARERAPAIPAARAALGAAEARLLGASALLRDNPEIQGAAGTRWTQEGELFEAGFGLRQVFELGGARAARMDSARAALARQYARGDDALREVLRAASVAFHAALYAEQRLRLSERAARLANETALVARRKHEAGDIGLLDLNVAAAAAARARAEVAGRAADFDDALAQVRIVTGMDASEPLALRGELSPRYDATLPELLARAAERPDVRALAEDEREAQADLRLGRAQHWPEVGVGVSYERDDGNNIAMGNLGFTVPVFERGQTLRGEAAVRERQAVGALALQRRRIEVEVRTAFEIYERRRAAVAELEREAVPAIDANEGLAQRSYEEGQIGVLQLLALRREMLETRADYLMRQLEAAVAATDLQASAGVLR